MPDILIRGMEMPKDDGLLSINIWPNGNVTIAMDLECKPVAKAVELPKHGDLIETKDVLLAIVEHGQRDKRFKLGDTIRYSPSEVKEIIDASVPVVVPAERRDADA